MGDLNIQIICDNIFFKKFLLKKVLTLQLIICFSVLVFMDVFGLTNDNKRT